MEDRIYRFDTQRKTQANGKSLTDFYPYVQCLALFGVDSSVALENV